MCWVLGLAHNKYKWSSQDSRLTSRGKEYQASVEFKWEDVLYFREKRGFQSTGDRTLILVFSLFTNSFPWQKERFHLAQGYLEKELHNPWFVPLDLLTFKSGCFAVPWDANWSYWKACGWPAAPMTGGQAYPIPNSKGRCWQANWGEPFKPHLPKQVRSVIEPFTFSPSSVWTFIQFWTWNVGGWTTEVFIDPLDSTDAQLILYCMWYTNQWTPMVCLLYAKLQLKAVCNFENKSILKIEIPWRVNLHERWSQPKMACKGYVMWDRLQL